MLKIWKDSELGLLFVKSHFKGFVSSATSWTAIIQAIYTQLR